eukprot:765147-Hanusia_phi.AAC.6
MTVTVVTRPCCQRAKSSTEDWMKSSLLIARAVRMLSPPSELDCRNAGKMLRVLYLCFYNLFGLCGWAMILFQVGFMLPDSLLTRCKGRFHPPRGQDHPPVEGVREASVYWGFGTYVWCRSLKAQ